MASQVVTSVELQVLEIRSYIRGFHAFRGSVIGGNFVHGTTVRDVRFVRYSEVRGVRISEVKMYGVHAVVGRGHALCPL